MAGAAAAERALQLKRQAAFYVRMSTDHQRYSTLNQAAALQAYADQHGLTVMRTYADEGKSGLRLAGRLGLGQLIQDVQAGETDFGVLLVYDISRWGRFQDADEGAYYEYLCRRAGVAVIYCAEPFENDGTPIATIVKSVKRAMAGEFSRELSVKVFAGHARLVRLGFRQGGPAGFGYRRQLVDGEGRAKVAMVRGDRKSFQEDRVVLVPGPDREVAAVRHMFRAFADDGLSRRQIALDLNHSGVSTSGGRPWTTATVSYILRCEKYAGTAIYGRTCAKLKARRKSVAPDEWIRVEDAHPALVERAIYDRVQARLDLEARAWTDGEVVDRLRWLLAAHGRLTARIINADPGPLRAETVSRRFGSLEIAYDRAGFDHARRSVPRRRPAGHRSKRTPLVQGLLARLGSDGVAVHDHQRGVFQVGDAFTFTVAQAKPSGQKPDPLYWHYNLRQRSTADFYILARQTGRGEPPFDFFILPAEEFARKRLRLPEIPDRPYSFYQFRNLEPLFEMARPRHGMEA